MVVVAICFAIPFLSTHLLFLGNCDIYFQYNPTSDSYKQTYLCEIVHQGEV